MLFNSIQYAFFLPIVFIIYWLLKKNYKVQNILIVIASYIFYGWWDWRFLLLIALTSFCSWGSGLLIARDQRPKLWVVLNVVINLAILFVFKYFNFFVSSFVSLFGLQEDLILIKLILPVGISFYTFQALSYSIDVYRGKIEATKDIVSFFAYVSFFPQLVAGPIERATNLLPQFQRPRNFSYEDAADGVRRILLGLFKKIVVADNCARYVNMVWDDYGQYSGSTLVLAAILFSFQIYGDFSGYSDIAIGSARLFGIRLKDNFKMPYFSRSVAELWRRWHISLNSWFVDYVYIPLGGSRCGQWRTIVNTFVIFLLSGLWHGANWTFVTWGAYHALLFVPLILMGRTKKYCDTPKLSQILQIVGTFILVTIGWIIFRAQSLNDVVGFISTIVTSDWGVPVKVAGQKLAILSVALLVVVEWIFRKRDHGLDIAHFHPILRFAIYYAFVLVILEFEASSKSFIYFQF